MEKLTNTYNEMVKKTEWFRQARYGAFIHFGIYSIVARGEWVKSAEKISDEDYTRYFEEFNPDRFDADEWARTMKEAGMKYAVLTTKHHDGFCLFDSKVTDYKSTNTKFGRDIIKEYVVALRKYDIKVGLYYSLIDWHHSDYPAYGDRQHPMRDNVKYKDINHNLDNYVNYMHEQVRELCTMYGKIDIMWFDFSYWNMKGEAWRATELVQMIRKLQPDVIIDNRLGGDMESDTPELYAGDFDGPEQCIPTNMIKNKMNNPLPWELCMTLNNSWGYTATDKAYKSPSFVIRSLVECVSKNGNLMVNIGPNGRGEIPKQTQDILCEVGEWLKDNGESIYGCSASQYKTPQWGYFTQKDDTLYAHIFAPTIGHMNMEGMKGKIKSAYVLSDYSEVIVTPFWNGDNLVSKMDSPDDIYLSFGNPVNNTYELPDVRGTAIRINFVK